jgi:hypothetical protein
VLIHELRNEILQLAIKYPFRSCMRGQISASRSRWMW